MKSGFRGIRLKMISNGSLRHYLAYATGEVLLIVIGILIAVQLSNLNDQRKSLDLERSYLERLAAEVRANVVLFSEYQTTDINGRQITERFATSSNDPSSADADLVEATREFFTKGWNIPDFDPSVTTFDDLKATGNLKVIRSTELREAIINLYASYTHYGATLASNGDWIMPIDSRITYEYDAMRWDKPTAGLFPQQSTADAARDIRAHAEILHRLAAAHFFLQDRMLGQYEEAMSLSRSVADKIESELNHP